MQFSKDEERWTITTGMLCSYKYSSNNTEIDSFICKGVTTTNRKLIDEKIFATTTQNCKINSSPN
jgi:predicted hydrolase (HD superfamily)